MAKPITTTFNQNAAGWTLSGDVKSSGWDKTGGDPGGYLAWVDAATGQDSYYDASDRYLGDKIGFYGGTLSYDILDTGANYTAYDVQIVGDGITLQYTNPNDGSFPTPNTWTMATVDLVAAKFIDTATGAAPTTTEMRSVMKDITQLQIRAEYVNGAESGGLDNVTLAPKPASAAAGFLPSGHAADTAMAATHHSIFSNLAHWIS